MTTADSATTQQVAAIGAGVTANRPPFLGMVQAELGKIIRWRAIWFTLLGIGLLMLLLNGLTYFITLYSLTNTQGLGERNQPPPPLPPAEAIPYVMMTTLLDAVRQYSGLVIAILAVMLIAAEFQFGKRKISLLRQQPAADDLRHPFGQVLVIRQNLVEQRRISGNDKRRLLRHRSPPSRWDRGMAHAAASFGCAGYSREDG